MDEAGGLLRQAQTHQQSVGRKRPCKCQSDCLSAMIESSSFLLRDAAEPQEMLLGCKQSLILGDLKLNAQIPAQAPRDLHHPPRRGQQCNGEFQNLHLSGNKVHGGDGISEPQGRNSFNLKTKIFYKSLSSSFQSYFLYQNVSALLSWSWCQCVMRGVRFVRSLPASLSVLSCQMGAVY